MATALVKDIVLSSQINSNNSGKIKVALADDHGLLRTALASLINNFEDCSVVLQVSDGHELIDSFKRGLVPDVVLLTPHLPIMDGVDSATWLTENYPCVHALMLVNNFSEVAMIRQLRAGVRGFLKKDSHPHELRFAIQSIKQTGFYHSPDTAGKLIALFHNRPECLRDIWRNTLTTNETDFLKLISSEMTYKEIASKLKIKDRSVDSLRNHLFQKLCIKSRTGLVLYAVKHGIVNVW